MGWLSGLIWRTGRPGAKVRVETEDSSKTADFYHDGTDAQLDVSSGSLDLPASLKIDGTAMTSTAAELNILDGVTATATEINTSSDLSVNGGLVRVKKLSISATPTGAEQDTTFNLPTKGRVLDVCLDVTTAEATGATKTMNVGLLSSESGGDADGFLAAVSVATTGVKFGTLASAGQTLGALMRVDESGAGVLVPEPHTINGTAVSVTYTSGSADWAEFRGAIYITYMEIG